jgi:hypothetical protein
VAGQPSGEDVAGEVGESEATFRFVGRPLNRRCGSLFSVTTETLELRLELTPEQAASVRRVFEAANAACNTMAEWAWEHQRFTWTALRKAGYTQAREGGLSAHFADRCVARVLEDYEADRSQPVRYDPLGPVICSDRHLRFDFRRGGVNVPGIGGAISFTCSDPDVYEKLRTWSGDCQLVLRGEEFWLLVPVDPRAKPREEPFRYQMPGKRP